MTDETPELPRSRDGTLRGQNPASQKNLHMFGSENANPHSSEAGSNKPWSIRNQLRYLARQPLDQDDPKAFSKLLGKTPTVAQIIAANSLAKATKADMRAVEFVTDQVDGKLAQPTLAADLAAMENMTDEQLYEIVDRFNAARSSPGEYGGEGDSDNPKAT